MKLLTPKLYAVRTALAALRLDRGELTRTMVLLGFAITTCYGIYEGVIRGLRFVDGQTALAYLPPTTTLGLVLTFLFLMLIFSNCVNSYGALFASKDLDLVLASPVRPWTFFIGKFLEVALTSSWMAMLFGIPALLAYAVHYEASLRFVLLLLLAAPPFFLIPTACGFIGVSVFARVLSTHRSQVLLVMALTAVLVGISILIRFLKEAGATMQGGFRQLLVILNEATTTTAGSWPPPWFASLLGEILQPAGRDPLSPLILLWTAAIPLTLLAFLAHTLTYRVAFSMTTTSTAPSLARGTGLERFLSRLYWFLPSTERALILKELRVTIRDVTQGIQLVLLLGITAICLYHVRLLSSLQELPLDVVGWWRTFLLGCTMALATFVVTAACTRFVVPSLSLEGQSFWLLETSPVPMSRIVRARFWCFLPPIMVLSILVFLSGALTTGVSLHVGIICAIMGAIVAWGVVGLGTGLGALFGNFDWESPSQLVANVGSLTFMLSSVLLMFGNITVVVGVIFLEARSHWFIEGGGWPLLVVVTLLALFTINELIVRAITNAGVLALERRARLR